MHWYESNSTCDLRLTAIARQEKQNEPSHQSPRHKAALWRHARVALGSTLSSTPWATLHVHHPIYPSYKSPPDEQKSPHLPLSRTKHSHRAHRSPHSLPCPPPIKLIHTTSLHPLHMHALSPYHIQPVPKRDTRARSRTTRRVRRARAQVGNTPVHAHEGYIHVTLQEGGRDITECGWLTAAREGWMLHFDVVAGDWVGSGRGVGEAARE